MTQTPLQALSNLVDACSPHSPECGCDFCDAFAAAKRVLQQHEHTTPHEYIMCIDCGGHLENAE